MIATQDDQIQEQSDAMGEEDLLREFLTFELATARRYQRPATLLGLASPERNIDPIPLIRNLVRQSDHFMHWPGHCTVVLMQETRPEKAQAVMERIRRHFVGQVKLDMALAGFPGNGETAGELLETLTRRLRVAASEECTTAEGN